MQNNHAVKSKLTKINVSGSCVVKFYVRIIAQQTQKVLIGLRLIDCKHPYFLSGKQCEVKIIVKADRIVRNRELGMQNAVLRNRESHFHNPTFVWLHIYARSRDLLLVHEQFYRHFFCLFGGTIDYSHTQLCTMPGFEKHIVKPHRVDEDIIGVFGSKMHKHIVQAVLVEVFGIEK